MDSSSLHYSSFKKAFSNYNVEFNYCDIAGLNTFDAVDFCLRNNKIKLPKKEILSIAYNKQKIARELINSNIVAIDGAMEFVSWASGKFNMSIVSSGSCVTVNLSLKKLGIKKLFYPILCADYIKKAKPDPLGFLMAVDILNSKTKDCLVFEDSDSGVAAAKKANIEVIDVRQCSFKKINNLILLNSQD